MKSKSKSKSKATEAELTVLQVKPFRGELEKFTARMAEFHEALILPSEMARNIACRQGSLASFDAKAVAGLVSFVESEAARLSLLADELESLYCVTHL